MSDAAEALKRWAWAFHSGDYTNAPQAVADLRGAARYIAELEAEEGRLIDYLKDALKQVNYLRADLQRVLGEQADE